MSSAGRAASSSGCVGRPRGRETGLTGYAEQIQRSLPTGGSAMETAEHREPYESRGSRTDLGAPGGASPPGDSTTAEILHFSGSVSCTPATRREIERQVSAEEVLEAAIGRAEQVNPAINAVVHKQY